MNTVFDTDSDASLNSVTFNTPDFAIPEAASSNTTSSPQAASSFNAASSGTTSPEAASSFNAASSGTTSPEAASSFNPVSSTCPSSLNDISGSLVEFVHLGDSSCEGVVYDDNAYEDFNNNLGASRLTALRYDDELHPVNYGRDYYYVYTCCDPNDGHYFARNDQDAYEQEVALQSPHANGEDAPRCGNFAQEVACSSPRLYVNEEDAPLNGAYEQEVALQSPHANGEDAPRYGAYVQNVVLPQPRLYANEEDAPLNGGYVQEMVVPLPPANEEFPSEVLTFLLREHPYEFVPFYRQRFDRKNSDLSRKEVSNWVFLFKIQRANEAWLTMEDVAASMWKKFTTKKQPRKIWGRYVFQDAEHEWLCVWVNYRRSTTVTNQIGGGQFWCGAKYACINYTPLSFAQDEGSRVFDKLTKEHLLALGDIFFFKEI